MHLEPGINKELTMIINLKSISHNKDTNINVNGLIITIDENHYDLSKIPKGGQAEAPPDSPFKGVITRDEVTIKYFYDSSTAELNQSTDRADYTFDVVSGEVPDPIKRRS
ncbi:MAG TPA: hypothetical protein VIC51_03085 [Psychromonas sp.]